MATPAARFNGTDRGTDRVEAAGRADHEESARQLDESALSQLSQQRSGDTWISRRAGGNGVVSVSWQQVCVGKHRAGRRIDVLVGPELLQFYDGDELLKTVTRTSRGEVRKKRATHD